MSYAALQQEQYISLKTFRKNGEGLATPVWFALEGDKLYVLTLENSGKHKRLKNNPQVELMPCDARGTTHGTTYKGQAKIHAADSEGGKYANNALSKKYGFVKRFFDLFQNLRGSKRVYFEIQLN